MPLTLEQRVESLERELLALKSNPPTSGAESAKGWTTTFGAFADDPLFDAAMDAGEAWRKGQTWEKESAASADAGS